MSIVHTFQNDILSFMEYVLTQTMKVPSFSSFNWSADYFALCLQKCLKQKALRPGKQVHSILLTTGIDLNLISLNAKLVGMYASCADVKSARHLFTEIQKPNVFAFNWMVLASTFNGFHEEAIGYFRLMQELGNVGNKFTFSVVLKACIGLLDLKKGKEVHAVVNKMGFGTDIFLANALIDMYCKCGNVCHARKLFDKMVDRDIASWTAMISGYCNIGKIKQADTLFKRMKFEGFEPNEYTWNAMIFGLACCGDSNGASKLFSTMINEGCIPDLPVWNALISGLAESQNADEAFKFYKFMLVLDIKPNHVTVTGLLVACGFIGSIQRGRELHAMIYRMKLEINEFVCSALIDMYAKCGGVKDAENVFRKIPLKNVASWNAMIGCYGKHGMVDSSIELFEKMQEVGIEANEVTLSSILFACSHSGLVEKGLKIFRSVKESYGLKVNKEHYSCVVDLLCRSGRIIEAYELIKEILPFSVGESIVGAFFNGCTMHGNKDMVKIMAKAIQQMDLKKPGGFVTLSNIHASDGEWDEVQNIRRMMREKSIYKRPGVSWVDKRNDLLLVEV